MSGLATLTRKELTESVRTRRLPVVLILFAGLGILSVLTARYLPEILELALGDEAAMIPLPGPTTVDAVVELQQNIGQIGALAAVVLAMGAVAWERERGTAALVLTKPVSRAAFLAAKIVGLGAVLGLAVAGAVAVGWIYTAILFEPLPAVGWTVLGILAWLGLMAWVSITFLASTVLRSAAAAAGVGIVAILAISLLSAVPAVGHWLPPGLDGPAGAAATGTSIETVDLLTAVVGTAGIIAGSFVGSWLAFRRQEL
jgi:ABC-2 type transport system permease protein